MKKLFLPIVLIFNVVNASEQSASEHELVYEMSTEMTVEGPIKNEKVTNLFTKAWIEKKVTFKNPYNLEKPLENISVDLKHSSPLDMRLMNLLLHCQECIVKGNIESVLDAATKKNLTIPRLLAVSHGIPTKITTANANRSKEK